MPELPEVETVVRTLRPALVGQRIVEVRVRRNDILNPVGVAFESLVKGREVAAISRRAKRIVIDLVGDERFYIHLGMTGRIAIERADVPLHPHTHLVLITSDSAEIRFSDPRRFGGFFWLGSESADGSLGPEPLTLKPAQLARQLARTTRAIKNALLDQTVIAGLGNIYVDESLFTAGIHPLLPANELKSAQIANLNRAIKATLRKALRHRGSTLRDYRDANGESGDFQKLHRVYDRAGEPCAKCKKPLERIVLGGRSTHYCAHCQKR